MSSEILSGAKWPKSRSMHDRADITPDKTRLGTMGHAAYFDDAAIEEGFVAGVVVADELASPVTQERLRMRATAAVREVVDDSLQVVVFARAVAPEIRAMRAAEAGL